MVIPTPISTCRYACFFLFLLIGLKQVLIRPVRRYYHRNLNPAKLVDIGFTPLSRTETISRLVRKYALPAQPLLPGFREMEERDLHGVSELLKGFMKRYEMSQVFGAVEEVRHWFLSARGQGVVKAGRREGQVVWSCVIEVRLVFFLRFDIGCRG